METGWIGEENGITCPRVQSILPRADGKEEDSCWRERIERNAIYSRANQMKVQVSRLSPKPMSSYFSCSTLLGQPTKVLYFSIFFYRYYPSNNMMEEYKCIDLINKIVKIRNFSLGIILHCQAFFFKF